MNGGIGLKAALAVVVAGLALVPPASADSKTRSDPDDTLGELDVSEAWHGHSTVRRKPAVVHGFRTFEPWSGSLIAEERGDVLWQMTLRDADGNFLRGRIVYLVVQEGVLEARVESTPKCDCPTKLLGDLRVKRPNDTTLRVAIPRSWLGKAATYTWSLYTQFKFDDPDASDCPDDPETWDQSCADEIGSFRHRL